jgi:hypothetical protein
MVRARLGDTRLPMECWWRTYHTHHTSQGGNLLRLFTGILFRSRSLKRTGAKRRSPEPLLAALQRPLDIQL